MKLGYQIRRALPSQLLDIARHIKGAVWKVTHTLPTDFKLDHPYVSVNIWNRIQQYYLQLPNPTVVEYGTGVSTYYHICNLIRHGRGTYIGIEHKEEWFKRVLTAVSELCVDERLKVSLTTHWQNSQCDVELNISCPDSYYQDEVCCVLTLRPPIGDYEGDGNLPEFEDYVAALDRACDIVVVDGRARNAVVAHVLETSFLRKGGLLVLLDAGRGIEGWLNYPAQIGASDYQPSVRRMLKMGGELTDGCGVDRWPGQRRRRLSGPQSFHFPSEACFLFR